MIPNPLWRPTARHGVVEHLLQAARGGAGADEASAFTGRTREVDVVVEWVTAREPGIRVVTEPPGTGKSAIVGRVVSLADPDERARLGTYLTADTGSRLTDAQDSEWGHSDPGLDAVHAHVHARGLTADRIVELLDRQLTARGILPPDVGDRGRNPALLVGELQRRDAASGPVPPVIVVDGLDEARGEAFSIADRLLSELAALATVIVATRQVPGPPGAPSLIDRLTPDGADIDLGTPGAVDRGRADLQGYVVRRLAGVSPVMDADVVADRLVTGMRGDQPFLLARVVTDQLRAAPVDTSSDGWWESVASSFEAAFEADLARVAVPGHRGLPADVPPRKVAWALVAALTWAFGAGFPEEEWLTAAHVLAPEAELDPGHISWMLEQAGRYVVQDGEGGTAVYRVAHQSIADLLHPRYTPTPHTPFDPSALPVATALTDRYRDLLEAAVPAATAGYLWQYLWRHVASAGPDALPGLRDLAARDASLRPDVAMACLEIAERFRFWGQRAEALPPTQEAVAIRRELAAANPAFLPDLAGALNNLGIRYSELGRRDEALPPTSRSTPPGSRTSSGHAQRHRWPSTAR
jgi:hypothetical protein